MSLFLVCTGLASTALLPPQAAAAAHGYATDELVELSLEDLANLTISSVSKKPENLSTVAASVFVITADDIRRSGATSLPEALCLAPNLLVRNTPNSLRTGAARSNAGSMPNCR